MTRSDLLLQPGRAEVVSEVEAGFSPQHVVVFGMHATPETFRPHAERALLIANVEHDTAYRLDGDIRHERWVAGWGEDFEEFFGSRDEADADTDAWEPWCWHVVGERGIEDHPSAVPVTVIDVRWTVQDGITVYPWDVPA